MVRIAVYHPVFGTGGGEAVCMNVLECLQRDHEPELYTLSDVDISYLNDYFNTDVSTSIPIRNGGVSGNALGHSYGFLSSVSPNGLGRLHTSIFYRLLRSRLSEYELAVSTFGEFSFGIPTIQYVHYPMFNRRNIPNSIESRGTLRRVYDEACDILSGYRRISIEGVVLANSEWTANLTELVHGVSAEPLYPPVDTRGFHPKAWKQRVDGFIAIGRVTPSKRIDDLIKIMERLQDRGHDVPLRIVGPTTDREYHEKIRSRVAKNDRITVEGTVSRERLIELVCSYRYGLHGMHHEHFGIVVAELVAGGAIPFVHDSGGQREIVNKEENLCYQSISDAVEKIERVLDNPGKQHRLRASLPDIEGRFGKQRFQREIRQTVTRALES